MLISPTHKISHRRPSCSKDWCIYYGDQNPGVGKAVNHNSFKSPDQMKPDCLIGWWGGTNLRLLASSWCHKTWLLLDPLATCPPFSIYTSSSRLEDLQTRTGTCMKFEGDLGKIASFESGTVCAKNQTNFHARGLWTFSTPWVRIRKAFCESWRGARSNVGFEGKGATPRIFWNYFFFVCFPLFSCFLVSSFMVSLTNTCLACGAQKHAIDHDRLTENIDSYRCNFNFWNWNLYMKRETVGTLKTRS